MRGIKTAEIIITLEQALKVEVQIHAPIPLRGVVLKEVQGEFYLFHFNIYA
jgi:hypothetical protein